MNGPIKVTAIVGSYRKGGVTDSAIDAILASAKDEGAEVAKIYLIDRHIEFCTNCRSCTQQAGQRPGKCSFTDDMSSILDEIERSDAIVLGSPMNIGTVTAVMKRFIERLVCFTYWPWGMMAPKIRNKNKTKRAVVVVSSAAPAWMGRLTTRIVGLLKQAAGLLGARTIGVLYIGLAASEERQGIGSRTRKKAHRLGRILVSRVR